MAIRLLDRAIASADSTISFTSGITSVHKEYVFEFFNMHPSNSNVDFMFQVNAAGASGYNEYITSSVLNLYNTEAAGAATKTADADLDQAQGTAFQILAEDTGNGATDSCSGSLRLFDPSDGTHATLFEAVVVNCFQGNSVSTLTVGGYINTVTAIDEIQFKFSAGNIDSGTIKMYGVL